ncbi:hypothetical protein DI392_00630 [Vibrio albus]|uniref:Lipoprotein n=1 Tax=Vibrio albus TaxID=2200953 RepID=A0A2U3BDH7_9VIBR|nr:hypothetical protein [Vibrio albus]PWI34823.1 hypothetical protein DI392_00630 [Vibrio albus]
MKRLLAVCGLVAISGCSTTMSDEARYLSVIRDGGVIATMNCELLGNATGNSTIWGGPAGLDIAMADLKNNAAKYPNATSILITYSKMNPISQIDGKVYDCSNYKPAKIEVVKSAKAETNKDIASQFEKAKKCQSKGGVWINNSCVISIE